MPEPTAREALDALLIRLDREREERGTTLETLAEEANETGRFYAYDSARTDFGESALDDLGTLLDAVHALLGDLDTESSASRQHYIDTGRYLRRGEAEEV